MSPSSFGTRKPLSCSSTRSFPNSSANRTADQPVRVWVLGCSTGQEAYSLAMTFLEFAAQASTQIPLQIFATDLNDTLLDKARAGLYSKGQVQDLSPERLRRFFVEEEGGFRICKPIRELCVFARHDVLSDPPFSRMDLLSCRNLMIYLEPVLQKRLLPLFHYALKPGGFLLLGSSETHRGLCRTLCHRRQDPQALFQEGPASAVPGAASAQGQLWLQKRRAAQKPRPVAAGLAGEADAQKEADRVLLAKYAPAGVLINEAMEVLQFRGHTGPYLEPPPGRASL